MWEAFDECATMFAANHVVLQMVKGAFVAHLWLCKELVDGSQGCVRRRGGIGGVHN